METTKLEFYFLGKADAEIPDYELSEWDMEAVKDENVLEPIHFEMYGGKSQVLVRWYWGSKEGWSVGPVIGFRPTAFDCPFYYEQVREWKKELESYGDQYRKKVVTE